MERSGFVERLVGARHIAKMSQAELAAAAGVSKSTIEGYEQGKTYPRTGVTALAEALGVDPHWLVFGNAYSVEQLSELTAELRFQTQALHEALDYANTQWAAFRARVSALEDRLVALEMLNERIYSVLRELVRRDRLAPSELLRELGPAPPPSEPPTEPE